MSRRTLRYHLRFQIIPGRNVERDARALAKFCRAHGIEEVVLFFAGEEWNNGLLSGKEEERWFRTLRRIKPILDKAGIIASLNPWMTTLHSDRGRAFPSDRTFRPMVSPRGEVSGACASFADPGWREYLCRLYGRFATLGFRVLWVEDDFRYHNHSPLNWGGGFEPEVLARFGKKIGRAVSREEVVARITQPGRPHPWRAKWMETWREIQLEVAEGLAKAVAGNAPGESTLGLMSSGLGIHSTEGRDWQKLFAALSIDGRVAHRPHYASYDDWPGAQQAYCITMLDAQRRLRPATAEVAPEVENFPYTRWTKSDSMAWTQMALAMFYGSDALLLNLFPFVGNPIDREPQVGELLDRSRAGLEWIARRFPRESETLGVGVPWREDAQAHVRVKPGVGMQGFDASPLEPGAFLISYGIPTSSRKQKVNALFGSLAWAFSDKEIGEMLAGGLMLDAVSAEALCERGFGALIGVRFKRWLMRQESTYSLECATAAESGVPVGHYSSVNTRERVAMIEPRGGAREWSAILTPESRRVGACVVAHRNRLGGRVVTYAVPNPAQLSRSYQRQALAQSAVRFLAGGAFESPLITGGAHLAPIHFRAGERNALVVFNHSPDPARPVIRLPRGLRAVSSGTLLAPLAKPAAIRLSVARKGGATLLTSRSDIPYLGCLVLEL